MASIWDQEMSKGQVWALMPQHKQRVRMAEDSLLHAVMANGPAYLSLSWGKQSMILAHMASVAELDVDCLFFKEGDETDIINDYAEVSEVFLKRFPLRYECINLGNDKAYGIREAAPGLMKERGYRCVIMGLAMEESRERRYTLSRDGAHQVFVYSNGTKRCCPLAKWELDDYRAYYATHSLPALNTYRRYGLAARTSSGLTPGSHAEIGQAQLTSEQKAQLDAHYRRHGVSRDTCRRKKKGKDYGDGF